MGTWYRVIAEIFGYLSVALLLLTYVYRSRKKVLVTKMTSDMLAAVHYLMLGETTGMVQAIVNSIRSGVFYHKGSKKWASHNFWVFAFIAVNIGFGLLTWQGWYSILPGCGSALAVLGFWCSDANRVRLVTLPGVLMWLLYGIMIGSLPTILANVLSVCSIAIGFWNNARSCKKAET